MKKYCIFILFLLFTPFLFATQIRHIGIKEGINGRQTFDIVRDKKGFMWISTRFGLDRYDGERIRNYPFDVLANGSVPARTVTSILDHDGRLWAYSDRGTIYQYDEMSDSFICRYELGQYLQRIFFDERNCIWFASQHNLGIIENNSIEFIRTGMLRQHVDRIRVFVNYDQDHILAATNKDILKINRQDRSIEVVLHNQDLLPSIPVLETCYYDPDKRELWIGTELNGVFIHSFETRQTRLFNDRELQNHAIRIIAPYKDSHMLLGTEGLGICVVDKEKEEIIDRFGSQSENGYNISGDAIYYIYPDELNNRIWVSTYADGVSVIDLSASDFKTIQHEPNNPNSLKSNIVGGMLEDSEGNIWVSTSGGLNKWNRKTKEWSCFLPNANVITIYEDRAGDIWVAAFSQGVMVLDKSGKVKNHYMASDNAQSMGSNFIYAIHEDKEGNIWLGGKRGNISKLDRSTGKFTRLGVSQINHITDWIDGHILISTEFGLYTASINTHKLTSWEGNKQFTSQYITDIWQESDSVVWLGTYGNGLNRCNLLNGTVTPYTKENADLRSNIIYKIVAESPDELWFSSENGIGRLYTATGQVQNYTDINGLSGNIFRQMSGFRDSNGIIYFGSYQGITTFEPAAIHSSEVSARIVLEDFYLFNRKAGAMDEHSPLKKPIDRSGSIRLSYKQHSFSIGFTAIDFNANKNHRFVWRLDGLDTDWINTSKERMATYTNLSPGKYNFQLQYIDENGQVLDQRLLPIIIDPPFWNTTWARWIELILLISVLYVVYEFIIFRIRKKESEEKIRFFIHTAHDIRTPLTLINGPLSDLSEEIPHTEKTDFLLKLMRENVEKLNGMFSKLLDFQKAYESAEELQLEEVDLVHYFRDKFNYWHAAAERKGILLELSLPENNTLIERIDKDKMDKILDNLLSNALKYTPENGTAGLELFVDRETWGATIRDTGIGISRVASRKLFSRFYRAGNAIHTGEPGSGLGLLLVKQYVTRCRGLIHVESVEKKGTVFNLEFPRNLERLAKHTLVEPIVLTGLSDPVDDDSGTDVKVKILIVEDNDHLREYMAASLKESYQVFTASNGHEAWKNIFRINPDIVVTDLQMPVMDGLELCRKMKNTMETSHIPVIFLTVVNDKKIIAEGFITGVDDYIEKPFENTFLKIKINNILRNRKLLRQKYLGPDSKDLNPATDENEFNRIFLDKATAVIERNIDNPVFTINDMTKALGLSRTILFNKFKTITGYTPNEYIKIVRFNKAILYFREKKYSINEIASMVGFEEPAYFSTCFKKIYGKTPSEFIEKDL